MRREGNLSNARFSNTFVVSGVSVVFPTLLLIKKQVFSIMLLDKLRKINLNNLKFLYHFYFAALLQQLSLHFKALLYLFV